MKGYVEEGRNVRHAIDAANPEMTFCGWAFDAPETEDDFPAPDKAMRMMSIKTVNCATCIRCVKHARGYRVAAEAWPNT